MSQQQQSDPTMDFISAFSDDSKWIRVENIPICIPHERTVKNSDGEEQTIVVTVDDLPMIADQLEERAAQYGVYPVMTYGHRQQTDPSFPEKDQPDIAGFTADHHFGYFGPSQVPAVLGTAYYKREEWEEAKKYPFRSMDYYPGTKKVTGVALLKRDPYLPLGMVTYAKTSVVSMGPISPIGQSSWEQCFGYATGQFDESEHPRDHGKFSNNPGGAGAKQAPVKMASSASHYASIMPEKLFEGGGWFRSGKTQEERKAAIIKMAQGYEELSDEDLEAQYGDLHRKVQGKNLDATSAELFSDVTKSMELAAHYRFHGPGKKESGQAVQNQSREQPVGYGGPAMMGPTNGFMLGGGKQEPVGHGKWRTCMKHAMKSGPVTYATGSQRGDSHTGDQVFDKKNKTGQWIEESEEVREEPEQVEYGLIRTGIHAASKAADAAGTLSPIAGQLNSLRHGDLAGFSPLTGQLNSAKRLLLGRSLLQKAPKPVTHQGGLVPVPYYHRGGYSMKPRISAPAAPSPSSGLGNMRPGMDRTGWTPTGGTPSSLPALPAPKMPSLTGGASASPPKLGGVSASASATPKLGDTSKVGGKLSSGTGIGGAIGGVAGAGAGGWAGGEIGDKIGGHTGRRVGNVVGGVAGALGGHALGTVAETAIGNSNTPTGYSNMPEPSGHEQWCGHMCHAISSHPKVKKGGPVGYDITPPGTHTAVGTTGGGIAGGIIGGIAGGAVGHPVAGAALGAAAGGMTGAAAANRPEKATTNVYKGVHEAQEKAQNGPVENANAKKSTMIGRGVDALSKSRVGRGLSALGSHTAKVDSAILSAPGKAIDAVSKSKVGRGLGRLGNAVGKVDSRIFKSVGMQDDQPIILYALGTYRKK